MIAEILEALGISKSGAIGAALGVIFSWSFFDELSKKARIITLMSGWFVAIYGAPLVVFFFSIPSSLIGGVGFLLGMFGMLLVGRVVFAIKNADLWGLVKSKFGGSQ